MDDNTKKGIESDRIYRKLTINMQNKMAKFKEGRSTKSRLNDQLIINISSLCRFLRKKEEEKLKEEQEREIRKKKKDELLLQIQKIHQQMLEQEKKDKAKNKEAKKKTKTKILSEEMQKLKKDKNELENKLKEIEEEETNSLNQTILDVFVPYSRLTKSLQNKLESLNEEIPEEEAEGEDDNMSLEGEDLNLENEMDHDKIAALIADEDADDNNNGEDDLNANTEFLTNDDLSISMSLFNKPVGFDEFKNNDNPLKLKTNNKDSFGEKESIKSSKSGGSNDSFKMKVKKDEQLLKANEEFKNILKPKVIKETVNEMSYGYLNYMYALFEKMNKKANENEENMNENNKDGNKNNQIKRLNFVNQFKSFILDIGISDKKFYEQCIREIIYNNKNELEFAEFLECFKKLVNLRFDQIFLKYKFLLHIVKREDDEYFTQEDLDNYYELIYNCKKPNEFEIQEEIRNKLLSKYKKIFPKGEKILTRQLSLVLEQFFDIK